MRIKIVNWYKYQSKRHDKYHNHWFRFNHSFFKTPNALKLSNNEKLFWIMLLSIASENGSDVFDFAPSYVRVWTRLRQRTMDDAFKKFKEFGWLEEIRETNVKPSSLLHNITEQTEHNRTEHNRTSSSNNPDSTLSDEAFQKEIKYLKNYQAKGRNTD